MTSFARALTLFTVWLASVVAGAGAPYLINAQQAGYHSRPEYIRNHFAHIDTLPFDGLTISTFSGASLMNGAPRSEVEMAGEFAPLRDLPFTRARQNFAWVNVDRPADFFGDWSVVVENFRRFARVLKEHGVKGIFLDNEEYARTLFNFPEDCSDRSKSLTEYQQQATLRGREIAESMYAEFPEMAIVVLHGPYSSHKGTPNRVRAGQTRWETEELRGPFTVGLMEGMSSSARLVDGGELYAYRTAEDFQTSYEYRKHGIASPSANCPYIPPALRPLWPLRISVAFGLHNRAFPKGATMNPAILRKALEHALRRCDEYVWLYFENANWNAPGEINSPWVRAVARAQAAASIPPETPAPMVSIVRPTVGSTYTMPKAIRLQARPIVGSGTVSRVEFFSGAELLGQVSKAPWHFLWNAPPVGSHSITARVSTSNGAVASSAAVPVTISDSFRAMINFQPAGTTPPFGYMADVGSVYGNRGNGYSYGWNERHNRSMRHRTATGDLQLATLCQMHHHGIWQIAVPNGTYEVTVAIGDGEFPSTHTINVEGVSYWTRKPLAAGQFVTQSRTVTVTDGKLTLNQGTAGHEQTRLNSVQVTASSASPAEP